MTSPEDTPLRYSSKDLLASGPYDEPLIAGGVRCHGGFDSSGAYRSPRTLHRAPAIRAWQAQVENQGHELIQIPRTLMPPQYPNVEQAKLLLRHGVRDPIVRTLTVISIVEGFGAVIRDVKVPDLGSLIVEPIEDTALAHLRHGLFEAHARDEAGYEEEGGHKQMWESARDLALEDPKVPGDVLMRLMGRRSRGEKPPRPFPEIDETLERMIQMMTQVLVVEVFAEGTFQWGIDVLSDPEVSAEPERAGAMVSYIKADEKPHVEYLRAALSELRGRTVRTVDGKTLSGRTIVDRMMHNVLSNMTRNRPAEQRDELRENLAEAIEMADRPKSVMEEFESLTTPWTAPEATGFEAATAASA